MAVKFIYLIFLAIMSAAVLASDGPTLQDFCVADLKSSTQVNGKACKDPKLVTASDFSLGGFHLAGNTSNAVGSRVTPAFAAHIPGLNTLGISMVRLDIAPSGINPLHTHPRATEILTVIEGTLEVGFITSNPDNRLISTILKEGDVFVFPEGLIHYQKNIGKSHAVAIGALNSQNPGVITIANAVFGSNPSIPSDVLAKAFQVNKKLIPVMRSQFKI
ncbi:putative germin-like protein 2-1 [Daucus carota subsp. sativus]|uniref:putative germin-like protein 2-1 n=1 Tax=Daucus carota subsp. sativus TaxID=79200 RepID=UPI0007EF95A7|nr:PREDICTED: putative germin-like protein 2-1 [Daucus carota subsp. sativus]